MVPEYATGSQKLKHFGAGRRMLTKNELTPWNRVHELKEHEIHGASSSGTRSRDRTMRRHQNEVSMPQRTLTSTRAGRTESRTGSGSRAQPAALNRRVFDIAQRSVAVMRKKNKLWPSRRHTRHTSWEKEVTRTPPREPSPYIAIGDDRPKQKMIDLQTATTTELQMWAARRI